MADSFKYDVFLSHSSKDKAVVRPLAERLKKDGLKVWFDEWVLKPGDSIPSKIEEGLEHSRVLVLCMSANAFGSDWAQLESGTFRFRDPLNKERRFIPLRLDDAPIKGSLAQFLYIKWPDADVNHAHAKLLESCRNLPKIASGLGDSEDERRPENQVELYPRSRLTCAAFSPSRQQILVGDSWGNLTLCDVASGALVRTLARRPSMLDRWFGSANPNRAHDVEVQTVVWSEDGEFAFSAGALVCSAKLWNVEKGRPLRSIGHWPHTPLCIAWGPKGQCAIFNVECSHNELGLWAIESGKLLLKFSGHTGPIRCLLYGMHARIVVSGSDDRTIRIWSIDNGRCIRVLSGHKHAITTLALSSDERHLVSGSKDKTLCFWEVESGRCSRIIEGHTGQLTCLAWSRDHRLLASGDRNGSLRLWDTQTGNCLSVIQRHGDAIIGIAWECDQHRLFSVDENCNVKSWSFSEFGEKEAAQKRFARIHPGQTQYTNVKVLLVGESGAGKTGLSKRLASNSWEPSDSTVGAWATQWKLPVASEQGAEREIWLWDFGGQADQRLIHQLYMDETALALLVFDGQKEDLFETLGQWDRDLTRASRKEFAKLLVAGRVDAGGLRVSRSEIEKFAAERMFQGFLETSSKKNLGCEELKEAILAAINWDEIPCRTTEVLFKQLKEEIIRLKDEGRVLMRTNELRETLQLRLSGEFNRFADEELRAVLTLLAGPGVVWELAFGSWVLLQPERINAYAQAVIRTLQADEHQRGCLMEERVLKGDLMYESSVERLQGDEERFVLLAMHQTLVERGLCLRQPTTQGNLLVFPSYYRTERPDIVQYPAVLVNYRFTGFLDELYATLVVRLHHSDALAQDELWRYAADFKTNAGKQLGIKLTRRAPGVGDLEVYFDPAVSMEEKIIFSKYVHEHLLQHARDVERLRHYVCPQCGTPVGNRDVAMKRLNDWLRGRPPQPETTGFFKLRSKRDETPSIVCVECMKQVPLWDEMEQCFASPAIQQRVRDMQEEAKVELDNESKERALVGEVISTVALAAQISREKNVSDHGIDMEIEFKDDAHEATHRFVFLQLKSGDSYTRRRKTDGTEVFTIKDERHARYWMASPFPVLLVIRNSEGEVRWMEVRDYLKRESENGKYPVKHIEFKGERFDVMSVRRWRDRVLASISP